MEQPHTEQTICLQNVAWNKKIEIPVDEDATLPDYCPDPVKLLKCFVTPRISNRQLQDGILMLEGYAQIQVLYLDADGAIAHYDWMLPFTHKENVDKNMENACLSVRVSCGYHTCRATSQRRLSLHGAVLVQVTATTETCVKPYSGTADTDLQQLDRPIVCAQKACAGEKSFIEQETIELNQTDGNPLQLLYFDGHVYVDEVKAMQNKVMVKGQLSVLLLYESDDEMRYHTLRTLFPFSQFVEANGVEETCRFTSDAQVQYLEIKPQRQEESLVGFDLNAKIGLQVSGYCETELTIPVDAYSIAGPMKPVYQTVQFSQTADVIRERYLDRTVFDVAPCQIQSVIWQQVQLCVGQITCLDGIVHVEGELQFSLLAKDSDNTLNFTEKTQPFSYEYETDRAKEGMDATAVFTPLSQSYTLVSDQQVETVGEYRVDLVLCKNESMPVLMGIDTDDAASFEKPNCSLIMYYAKCGEKVWDIAKRYHGNLSDITELNHLEEPVLAADQTLLIPVRT